jgi:hypothetical protein
VIDEEIAGVDGFFAHPHHSDDDPIENSIFFCYKENKLSNIINLKTNDWSAASCIKL